MLVVQIVAIALAVLLANDVRGETSAERTDSLAVPGKLKSVEDIRKWAAENSWGGSTVDSFTSNGLRVAIARRAFTSGVETCALTVFAEGKDGWLPRMEIHKIWGAWLDVKQSGDTIEIQNSRTKKEVARFAISELLSDMRGRKR